MDAGTVLHRSISSPNPVGNVVHGVEAILGLYGLVGVVIIGLLVWLILYTWKIWPKKIIARKAIDISPLITTINTHDNQLKELNNKIIQLDERINNNFKQVLEGRKDCQKNIYDLISRIENNLNSLRGDIKDNFHTLDERFWNLINKRNVDGH